MFAALVVEGPLGLGSWADMSVCSFVFGVVICSAQWFAEACLLCRLKEQVAANEGHIIIS